MCRKSPRSSLASWAPAVRLRHVRNPGGHGGSRHVRPEIRRRLFARGIFVERVERAPVTLEHFAALYLQRRREEAVLDGERLRLEEETANALIALEVRPVVGELA